MSNADVCVITGHKDQRSVDRYDRPSDARRRAITSVLNVESTNASTSNMTLDHSSTNLTIQAIPEKRMKIKVDGNKNTIEFDFS